MSIFTNRTGISIYEDKVQLVEISREENDFYLENVDEEFFEDSIQLDTKEAKFIYILQNAFNEILLRQPLISKNISVTLPSKFFKIIELPVDKNLTKNDLNEYIKWELEKLFPSEKKGNFMFQKVVLNPLHFDSSKRIIVYAIQKAFLGKINKFCVRNNLSLRTIDSSHLAVVGFINSNMKDGSNFSLFIDQNTFTVSLFFNGGLIAEKSFNYNSITKISELLDNYIKELFKRNILSSPVNNSFIFGDVLTKELKQNLEESFEFNIIENNPFTKLKIKESMQNSKFVTEQYSKFSAATAIALRI